jgi:hypothetical protein
MKRALAAFAFCLLGLALIRAPAFGDGGWTQLLDGKSLDGFEQIGDANWRLEDGVLVADRGNGYLVSKASYTDFELRAEFWVGDDANSGVFIRCTDPREINAKNAYEVNIWDERPQKDCATGAIVNVAKVDPMPTTVGKWSTYEIIAKGDTFTVVLNGQKTVDGVKDDKLKTGRIALQHGLGNKDASGKANDKGVVKFRKVEIRPLPPAVSN